jgi:hypothetical protein
MSNRLPCMAVKQPYASLLVSGIKDVENRSSAMPEQLRGRWCAIYASKTLATVGSWVHAVNLTAGVHTVGMPWPAFPGTHDLQTARKQATRGAIVGLVKWVDSAKYYPGRSYTKSPWAESGAHHWTYSDRIVLPEPVPLPDGGCQSLYWYLDALTRSNVLAAVKAVAAPWHELVYEEPEPLTDLTGCDV